MVIHLGGLNADECKAMLPAFELVEQILGLLTGCAASPRTSI
ncbi:hypothetical protein [Streptomyces sp. NPDC048248]